MGEAKDEFAPPKTGKVDDDGKLTDKFHGHEHAARYARRLMRALGRKPVLIPDEAAKQKKIEAAAALLSEYRYTSDTARADDKILTLTDDEMSAYFGDSDRLVLMKWLEDSIHPASEKPKGKPISLGQLKKIVAKEKARIANELKGDAGGEAASGTQRKSLVYQTRAAKLAEHLISEAEKDQENREKADKARRAVQALLYIESISKLAAPDDNDSVVLRARLDQVQEEFKKLLPWDDKLQSDAGSQLDQAYSNLNLDDLDEAEDLMEKVESRMATARDKAKKDLLTRLDTLEKDIATEVAKGSDLSTTDKHLAEARASANKGDFELAKAEIDKAKLLLIETQGKREIDITKEIEPVWRAARSSFENSLESIEDRIRSHKPASGETTVLAKMGIKAWTTDPLDRVTKAIRGLSNVSAGPTGMKTRLRAVATFREVKASVEKHPAGPLLAKNPWKVDVDIAALTGALDQISDTTLKSNGPDPQGG
ncbi:hypothetical protein [Actibacterium pelagium]|uniref:Uncharacterized protein n=1 Tax=Actibacterium pelagium TaxID=2029103 RepID=A0A917AJ69_9RHOB|nr:hypothetical protein [Actibacterium pelagium]GGE56820.1 hypothetical protein GCM10011517_25740 [Actibacterium pelagium]